MEAKKDGQRIELTSLEFKILLMLFTNKNKLVTREMILNKIWDLAGNFVNDNTLTVYIKRIREKIGDNDGKIIKTIRGVGYKVDEKNPSQNIVLNSSDEEELLPLEEMARETIEEEKLSEEKSPSNEENNEEEKRYEQLSIFDDFDN